MRIYLRLNTPKDIIPFSYLILIGKICKMASFKIIDQENINITALTPIKIKKGELPHLDCVHNGIILIVNCFQYEISNFLILNKNYHHG